MKLFLSLTPTICSKVSYSVIVCVFHKLFKRPMILAIKSKQYALANLREIINALGALLDNGLKSNHSLCVPLPSTNPSSSTDRIPQNIFLVYPEVVS